MPPIIGRPPSVVVAVPTYRRPRELDALLTSVLRQADDLRIPCQLRITVVDNDAALSAEPVVRAHHDIRLRYIHEPKPGVVAVRNRALRHVWDDDVVIFIDDDQLPTAGWLAALIDSWTTGADAVAGPVVSELPEDADHWVRDGGFFDRRYRRSLRTGDRIDEVATTNLLLDMTAIRPRNLLFDERFGLSGGEDSLFTRTLTSTGGTIVWSAEARVIERVPADRATRSWVRRRAISAGNGGARVRLALADDRGRRSRVRIALLGMGLARWGAGGAGIAVGRVRGSITQQGRSTRTMMRGLGMSVGALGFSYLEYARDGRHWRWDGRRPEQSKITDNVDQRPAEAPVNRA